jgi:transcriptional regulator with XRE-family HTH domain
MTKHNAKINSKKNQSQKENSQDIVAGIKLIREELGMTQLEFAVALGINPVTVSRAERGLAEPSLTLLQFKKLCELTKKSARDFPDYLGKPN